MVDVPRWTSADAFVEELFARHHGEIYAYLVRMLRDPELAADLTQDAFVKAYRSYGSLQDPAHARAWLYQIAHRVALDELRRRKIVRFLPWTGESYGHAPSAEHLAMVGRLSAPLQRALARIPERQRAALLLAEFQDLTGVELAAALGVSHVAARALLTRARESLRQALAAEQAAESKAEAQMEARAAARSAASAAVGESVRAGVGARVRPAPGVRPASGVRPEPGGEPAADGEGKAAGADSEMAEIDTVATDPAAAERPIQPPGVARR